MPSMPALVYAALLYKDGEIPANPESKDFVQGTATEDGKLIFSFQRPDDTSGKFTLEICAFKTDTSATVFSRATALLSGKKVGCKIEGDKINVSEPIALSVNSSSEVKGTVSLKIKVPEGCSLEIDDARFSVTGTSPDFTVTQAGDGISAGAYQVTFTVKKESEIVHIFSEYINVFPGMRTDTWSGLEKDAAKEITQSMISSTVYVRGTDGYYDTNSPYNQDGNAMADDEHTGSFLSPLATIQKAIDKIIAINDGASAYTICVDGTLTATDTTYIGMADFSALAKNLTLTIKTLSGTATLDANQNSRVIYAKPASGILNLTLENIAIMGGNASNGSGGGIYFYSAGGTLKISDGTTISGNEARLYGGGVYVDGTASMFTMNGGTISDCTATDQGGGVYIKSGGTFEMLGTAKITGCTTTSTYNGKGGGGVYVENGTFTMNGGTISECTAEKQGCGVYISSTGKFEMSGTAKITGCKTTSTSSSTAGGGGIYNLGALTMTGGTISDCISATDGGGVYVTGSASTFTMNGGTISGNTATANGGGVYVEEGTFTMSGGTISDCTATLKGGGVFINSSGTFKMSGTAKITGCKTTSTSGSGGNGGGAYVNSGTFTMSDGTISDNTASKYGGGVYIYSGTLTMSGGTISDNTAKSIGGGVYIASSGTFNLTDGTIGGTASAEANTAQYGGGVYVYTGNFTMEGGTVSGNTATNNGGGVYVSRGTFTMKSGAISGNTTTNNGGGVYVYDSNFTMEGGEITDNMASANGGGVYAYSTFKISGSASIPAREDGMNDVYLANGKTITVAGALTAESPVATITPSDYTAGRQVLSAGGSITDITQDICDKFAITPQADGMEWKIVPDGANGVLKAVINVYVRGSGEGWYTDNGHGDITGSDDNSGDRLHPFATIQKAVAAVKNLNDGETECTIYVDGTVTQETASSSAMVNLENLAQNLTLTIKSLSETKRATLDANNLASVVYVSGSNIDLAIENLILCNGKNYGLYLYYGLTVTFVLSGCEISGNRTVGISIWHIGTFAIENCEIINNSGRGVILETCLSGTITGSKIKNNTNSNSAGLCVSNTEITIKDCEISGNTNTSSGGGIELYDGGLGCSLIMEDCEISGNKATMYGGGVYVGGGEFIMNGGKIIDNTATTSGGGVYVRGGEFIMNGGKIIDNTADESGGGVYKESSGTFTKNGGEISGNTPDDVYP